MDTVTLSRIQFAMTAGFHFIFVPLTLGLSLLVAWMETLYVRTGDELYLRMTKFWGKLFLINFVVGVVTGITLEFQFGMNWAEYSKYVGDIFGVPLAIEATVAFFLESVFIGLWIFGWDRVSKKVHCLSIWIVALAGNLSALWILIANGWMQHPVGYVLRNGRAEMVDFWAVLTNSYGWLKFGHTIVAGYVVGAFFVMAVSAYHILRKQHLAFFKRSFRMAATFALASAVLVVVIGDFHGAEAGRVQPAKLAAMEALWDTREGVPFYLILIPDTKNERNSVEAFGIPKIVSFLAYRDWDAELKGLKEFPEKDRPPVMPVFVSFRVMVGLGFLFIGLAFVAWYLARKDRLESSPLFLRIMLYAVPLPYIAAQLGWIVAEMGRQPWIVYGVLRTSEGVSRSIEPSQVMASLVGFGFFYSFLGILDIYLLARFAGKGPDDTGVAY